MSDNVLDEYNGTNTRVLHHISCSLHRVASFPKVGDFSNSQVIAGITGVRVPEARCLADVLFTSARGPCLHRRSGMNKERGSGTQGK